MAIRDDTPAQTAGDATIDRLPPRVAEQISAWLDDELPRDESELLLARVRAGDAQAGDPAGGPGSPADAVRSTLARYALVSAALRGSADPAALQVADRVARALRPDGEPLRRVRPHWATWGLAAGLACAMAITLAVAPGAGWTPATMVAGSPVPVEPIGVALAALPPERITDYLVYHGEYSGSLSAALVDTHIVAYHPAAMTAPSP